MTAGDRSPTRDEVRLILVAAADVIFSDGVSDAFLDHWADETVFVLSLLASRQVVANAAPVELAEGPVPAHVPRT